MVHLCMNYVGERLKPVFHKEQLIEIVCMMIVHLENELFFLTILGQWIVLVYFVFILI